MDHSDWVQLVSTIVGVGAGIWTSWYFFRIQMIADYRTLTTKVELVDFDVKALKDVIDTSNQLLDAVQDKSKLDAIHTSVDTLNEQMKLLGTGIVSDIKAGQNDLIEKVQARFERELDRAQAVMQSEVQRHLSQLSKPEQRDAAVSAIVDLVKHGIKGLGQYQRLVFETETDAALARVSSHVDERIADVKSEVATLRSEVTSIVPPSKPEPIMLSGG